MRQLLLGLQLRVTLFQLGLKADRDVVYRMAVYLALAGPYATGERTP